MSSTIMMKENQVFKILRDETLACLSNFNLTPEKDGVDVRRFSQANVVTGDKIVLLNLVSVQRIGWQASNYKSSERIDEWIEEQSWQFSCIKKMLKSDTQTTVSADDMCNMLIAWYNGVGNLNLRMKGIANTPIDPTSILVYNDDSDLYQRRPVFTMDLQVPKWLVTASGSTDILVQNHLLP